MALLIIDRQSVGQQFVAVEQSGFYARTLEVAPEIVEILNRRREEDRQIQAFLASCYNVAEYRTKPHIDVPECLTKPAPKKKAAPKAKAATKKADEEGIDYDGATDSDS